MPAVGDIRNRLLALADSAVVPASVMEFCASRLPEQSAECNDPHELRQQLRAMSNEAHPAWAAMPAAVCRCLAPHLNFFLQRMPEDFDPFRAAWAI